MTMKTAFQNVMLATNDTDDHAVLVMRDGRLAAVLTRLGDMHEDVAGQWFVEAMFGGSPPVLRHVFESPDAFVQWLDERDV